MYIIVITLCIAIAELIILWRMQTVQKVKLLTNYKYLVADYKLNLIQSKLKILPPDEAIIEIDKILKMEVADGSNKVLQNKSIKRNIRNKETRNNEEV